jgi:ABC-type Fe3+/spermidine/putrescine transport system ATPase subunit
MAGSLHARGSKLSPAIERGAQSGEVELIGVSKAFGGVLAANDCSLVVNRGEIIALLGPSGCGKSTLLNIIAGFEVPDAGTIRLRGKVLNHVPPHRRNVAMVFQHYALFPHLTVAGNIAYGLRARRMDAAEMRRRVDSMLALLKLDGLGERYPSQLSGGQRQRVAIARALAIDPDVLLLDESFSALDRNLREEMQLELSLLLRRLNITTILVTHDQREAFSLADRVAVMQAGRIAQIGTPREMYEKPVNSYVLQFLGSSNRLSVDLANGGGGTKVRVAPGIEFTLDNVPADIASQSSGLLHLRTEDVALVDSPSAVHSSKPGVVTFATFLGAQERVVVQVDKQQIIVDRPAAARNQRAAEPGVEVYVDFDPRRCRLSSAG